MYLSLHVFLFVKKELTSLYVLHVSTLSKDIERVKKRCLKIIYPNLSYSEALKKSGLARLDSRREEITQCTFRQVKCPTHPLYHMLPPCKVSTSQMTLRPTDPFTAVKCKKQDMVEI